MARERRVDTLVAWESRVDILMAGGVGKNHYGTEEWGRHPHGMGECDTLMGWRSGVNTVMAWVSGIDTLMAWESGVDTLMVQGGWVNTFMVRGSGVDTLMAWGWGRHPHWMGSG